MPARRQLLQKITLNSTAASVTFSNIPQIYTDLKIIVSARSDRANVEDSLKFRFNGDSGSNYTSRLLYGNGSSAISQNETSVAYGTIYAVTPAATATANTFGTVEMTVPSYAGASTKAVLICGASESNTGSGPSMGMTANLWNSTAAINSVTLFPYYGSWVTGSTFYLYGLTQVPVIVGGTETISGGWKYHTFTSTSSLRVVEAGQVEYLVVAGGGSGGVRHNGGGGAGGFLTGRVTPAAANYTITVGAGGAGWPVDTANTPGVQGSNSSAFGLTAIGGGGGANGVGGSGGGGNAGQSGGAGTAGQGNAGGAGVGGGGPETYAGGGGGGANAAGSSAGGSPAGSGAGGAGREWPTGSNRYYAGGGAGGLYDLGGTAAVGGIGGGGSSVKATATPAGSGAVNSGGGGAGSSFSNAGSPTPYNQASGSGGSGIVIIRYPYISN